MFLTTELHRIGPIASPFIQSRHPQLPAVLRNPAGPLLLPKQLPDQKATDDRSGNLCAGRSADVYVAGYYGLSDRSAVWENGSKHGFARTFPSSWMRTIYAPMAWAAAKLSGRFVSLHNKPSPSVGVMREERLQWLAECFEKLSHDDRQILQWSMNGLSYEEIANQLGATKDLVRGRLAWARENLRDEFCQKSL